MSLLYPPPQKKTYKMEIATFEGFIIDKGEWLLDKKNCDMTDDLISLSKVVVQLDFSFSIKDYLLAFCEPKVQGFDITIQVS